MEGTMSGHTHSGAAADRTVSCSRDESVQASEGVFRLWDLTRLCSKEHHSVAFSAGFQIVSVFCELTIKIFKCKYKKYHKKEKDSKTTERWSDLDQEILEHVLRHLCHCDGLRFGSVCRWWRTVQAERIYPPTHFPWILLPNQNLDSERQTLYSPSDGFCFEICVPPKALGKIHFASYLGWLLMVDGERNDHHLFLFNLYSGGQVELPEIGFYFGMLDAYMSSEPSNPDCIVAFPSFPHCGVMLCRVGVGENMWTEYTGNFYRIRSLTSFRGRLYCIDVRRNLITLDLGDTGTGMVLVPMEDGELPLMRRGKEHAMLVESYGELLMVLVAWKSASSAWASEPGIGVQVFRADLSNMAWVKVRSLGDRVLFMGRGCSTSLSAANIGGQGNHIYLSYGFEFGIFELMFFQESSCWCWLDYDLGSGKARHLRPPLAQCEVFFGGSSFWVAPDYLHQSILDRNPSASSWHWGA